MASYNELNALIDAYINRNGVQAITGQILNGVLKAMVDQIGRGYAIMGTAVPTDDPGTPDAPESWFASTPGTYTNFGGFEVADAEFALLSYTPSTGWAKNTLTTGITEVSASIDGNVGTPEVTAEYINGGLIFTFSNMKGDTGEPGPEGEPGQAAGFGEVSATVDNNIGIPSVEVTKMGPDTAKAFYFSFHNLKGEQGVQGVTGDAAGFGTVNATMDGNIGTPGVSVNTSGPDTAKNITFAFRNLKGETGVTSVVATVDNTSGTPSCAVSLVGQELHLDFHGLKGDQGDTGSSVDYPFTIVNNLTTDDATQALSAAQGVVLAGQVSQLEAELHNLSGKFYGVFADDSDLPEGDAVGYAFVGTENPYAIWNFDGEEWSDSGSVANGITGEPGVGFSSIFTPDPYDGTVIIVLSNNDTITLDLNHNHPAYYSKVAETSNPSGGFLPDVVYSLGTLSGTITFSLASAVTGNVNHYFWMFDTDSTAPTITWPAGLTWAAGSAPTVAASKHYEISVLNGIAYYSEV